MKTISEGYVIEITNKRVGSTYYGNVFYRQPNDGSFYGSVQTAERVAERWDPENFSHRVLKAKTIVED